MSETINLSHFKNYLTDDDIWLPISKDKEKKIYLSKLKEVESYLISGTNEQKGESLEKLMTFIYSRFTSVKVKANIRTSDNQLDHEIVFSEYGLPPFISTKMGTKIIGESKNHNRTVSSREVDNLDGLLRIRNSNFGIISSYHPFSRGRSSVWVNGEGKRRKLALLSDYRRIIIGIHYKDLLRLSEGENFYTIIQQKYNLLIDELADDYVEDSISHYHKRIYESFEDLSKKGIIPQDHLITYKNNLITKYGPLK
ncbi:hypothetical protein [Solibacillus cecembensis]|uniref:hypothetical protein n=1 Tax=Solibacillus cecembensis TaxID=459347 RepID=UPI003CFEBD41